MKRNLFPKWLIDKSVKGYLSKVTTTGKDASKGEISNCHFYKLPYIGYYSSYTGKKISSIVNKYCKDLNVKIIFSPFKLSTMFSPKDFIPDSLKSRVVYQFTCASCGARYIGETNRHFNTRVNEHLFRDKNSHIFKHLSASKGCRDKCDISCFKILDHASTYSQLKVFRVFILNSWNLNSTNKLSTLVCRCISKFIYCCLQGVLSLFFSVISFLSLSFCWLV